VVLERSVEDLLPLPHPSPERLHRLHGEFRRVRVELRLWRHSLPSGIGARVRALDRRLDELARRVGETRDSDVRLGLLEQSVASVSKAAGGERRAELQRQITDDARIRRELLRAQLRVECVGGLFAELKEGLIAHEQRTLPQISTSFLSAEIGRMRAGLRQAYRRASRRPSTPRTHRLRILLRRSRHLSAFFATIPGAPVVHYPNRLVRLQQILGRVRDLELICAWVEDLSPGLRHASWAHALRKQRKVARGRLSERLGRKSTRAAIRTLGTDPGDDGWPRRRAGASSEPG
jgi:CHAD domain-containing protein